MIILLGEFLGRFRIGEKNKYIYSIMNIIAKRVLLIYLILFKCFLFSYNNDLDSKRHSIGKSEGYISSKLKASFYYYPPIAFPGQLIRFYDASIGNPDNWIWSFGDGGVSYEKNPVHIYEDSNIYNITLRVAKENQINTENKLIIIRSSVNSSSEKPKADFVFDPENPQVGLPVKFYDISTGNPDQRIWQFGYFDFSFLKDPIKVFLVSKNYVVSLTVRNKYGSDKCIKYIKIGDTTRNIIIAKSCSLADVQAAIAQANPGDTVVVPNGSTTWNQQLVINKGIILKAATKGGVTITMGFEGQNFKDSNYLIKYEPSNPSANEPFRISGFKFDGNHKGEGITLKNTTTTAINRIRIDNNEFSNWQTDVAARVINIEGTVYGVADNNIFYNDDSSTYRAFSFYSYYGGQDAWKYLTYDHGTADNFYFEDNIIYTKNVIATDGAGGRYAFRHNNIILNQPPGTLMLYLLDAHGNMGEGGNWGQMGVEFYENDIELNSNGIVFIDIRGGKGLIYNNRVTNMASTPAYQVREEYYDWLNPPAKNLISGQPQYVSECYFFNQTNNGNKIYPRLSISQTLDYGGGEGIVPREDVHVFIEKSSFDGSSGVGVGTLSQRPASCTKEGVAWWATDEKKLYRWHNGKWELYYIPYTYPHPLRTVLGG